MAEFCRPRPLEGLLRTKQTYRDKDALDRVVIERALASGRGDRGA